MQRAFACSLSHPLCPCGYPEGRERRGWGDGTGRDGRQGSFSQHSAVKWAFFDMATSKRAMALSLECRWSRQPGHFSDLKLLNCPPDMIKKNSLAAYSFLHCVGWILWKQGSVNGRVCHLLGEEAHSLFQPPLQNENKSNT